MMQTKGFSALSVQFYQTKQHHVSEERYLQVKIKLWESLLSFSPQSVHLPFSNLNTVSHIAANFHNNVIMNSLCVAVDLYVAVNDSIKPFSVAWKRKNGVPFPWLSSYDISRTVVITM
jgi:hypothetical protein